MLSKLLKKKSTGLSAVLLCLSALSAHQSSAAVVTSISALDIGGIAYDVTFHTAATDSFDFLWDPNGDGVYGDGNVLLSAPTFTTLTTATNAYTAVAAALGTTDTIMGSRDFFLIPYLRTSPSAVSVVYDSSPSPATDTFGAFTAGSATNYPATSLLPYASFALASGGATVPAPISLYLMAAGLLGLGAMAKRRKAV